MAAFTWRPGVFCQQAATLVLLGAAVIFAASSRAFPQQRTESPTDRANLRLSFNETIQPILSENCYPCHGPDPGARKAGLRLDRGEFPFLPHEKDGDKFGPAIIRGEPDKSPLVWKIEAKNPKDRMPPPEAHKTLSAEQIALLRRWIRQGAQYEEHWAFIAPTRPAVPEVADSQSVSNAIDNFILARIEKEGLTPSPEADQRTLIRRVTYDLTGLPPKPEEVEAFLRDSSPEAYEKVVDRLLASPHYGEHRAHYWLDYARFADTTGLHFDNYRSVWPYRDYVIRAYNQNKPFDQFVLEQLAGDLLPAENVDQLVATGFDRIHITSNEGGAIPEELQFNLVKDRVETVSTVFLGLTMGCAVCHDHKFDPIKQKEFYQMSAFFNNTADKFADDTIPAPPPTVIVPTAQKLAAYNDLLHQRASVERQLRAREDEADENMQAWIKADGPRQLGEVSRDQLLAWFPFDEGEGTEVHNRAPGASPATYQMTGGAPHWDETTKFWAGLRFSMATVLSCPALGDFDTADAFTVAGWFEPRYLPQDAGSPNRGAFVSRMRVLGKDDSESHRGWDLYWDGAASYDQDKKPQKIDSHSGTFAVHLSSAGPKNEILVRTKQRFDRADWRHVAFSYNGSGHASGVRIAVNGKAQELEVIADELSGSIRTDAPLQFGKRTEAEPFGEARYQDVRIYGRALDDGELDALANDDVVKHILLTPREQWTEDQRKAVRDVYLARFDPEAIRLRAALAEFAPKLKALEEGGTPALISREKDSLPRAHVLDRGVYSSLKERVSPEVPAVLPPLPAGARRDRLALAQWLISPANPLLARVTVNRMWQEIFGTGIVETTGDFGVAGARPSHRALLDWLASDFRDSGWDVKRMYKQLVMSRTYRQAARVTPQLLEKDPQNRLLARGPRFRMDAEMVRDTALAASGILSDRIGGPSVKPYQPPGIWEAVRASFAHETYEQDHGEAVYRRSLYSFWKRTAPPPVLETFNAPDRGVCLVRRERTNTPLQALVVMNSPDFLEAARHLAEHAWHEAGNNEDARLQFMAVRVLSRPLGESELKVLRDSLSAFAARMSIAPDNARTFLSVGDSPVDATIPPDELAEWTLVASQFLNLDEALTK
jgi:hypothetical protein